MVLPERDHAAQQFRPTQHGAVSCAGAADRDVAATTRGEVSAVIAELALDQPMPVSLFGQQQVQFFQLIPSAGGWQVHLQHARIRRQAEGPYARVRGRRVALDPYRLAEVLGCLLHRGDQIKVVGDHRHVGEEHMQPPLAGLHAQRRAHKFLCLFGLGARGRQGIRGGLHVKQLRVTRGLRCQFDPVRVGSVLMLIGELIRSHPRHRFHRDPIAHGRVARREGQTLRPREPQLA